MKKVGILVVILVCCSAWLSAQTCQDLAADLKLPTKFKTRGKPRVGKWEDVDKVLNALDKKLEVMQCSFTFSEVFKQNREDVYFPVTNSVVRIVPEDSLMGLTVFTKEEFELGEYAGAVRYEKSGGLYAQKSYSLFYFQYMGKDSNLHSVGSRLLLDDFVVKWDDIKDRVAVVSN